MTTHQARHWLDTSYLATARGFVKSSTAAALVLCGLLVAPAAHAVPVTLAFAGPGNAGTGIGHADFVTGTLTYETTVPATDMGDGWLFTGAATEIHFSTNTYGAWTYTNGDVMVRNDYDGVPAVWFLFGPLSEVNVVFIGSDLTPRFTDSLPEQFPQSGWRGIVFAWHTLPDEQERFDGSDIRLVPAAPVPESQTYVQMFLGLGALWVVAGQRAGKAGSERPTV